MLELPGLVVDVQSPPTHIKLEGLPQEVKIEANIAMLWGCPLTPGGVWEANKFEVKTLLKRDGKHYDIIHMSYAGAPSQFVGNYMVKEKGVYEGIVYAYDPANGNTGLDNVTFIVQ